MTHVEESARYRRESGKKRERPTWLAPERRNQRVSNDLQSPEGKRDSSVDMISGTREGQSPRIG